jgi:phosphate transport system substrate-binding protein
VEDAYPISGLTFLLVYRDQKDPAKAKALAEFIRWANSEGQDVAGTLDYARLPQEVVKVNQTSLMLLRVGGKPILASR